MQVNSDNITAALRALFLERKGKRVSWRQIMTAIETAGMTIENAMMVRSAIYHLSQQGLVNRTEDVIREMYFVPKTPKA